MSNEQTIRRGVRNSRYTTTPNALLEDVRLSPAARWLVAYLLSKPDNWIVRLGDIQKKAGCGVDKARAMIREMLDAGYAEREEVRENGKFAGSALVVYDEPINQSVTFLPHTDLPCTVEPDTAKPCTANPTLVITDNLATPDQLEDSPQPPDEWGADAALADQGEKLKGRERHQVEADFHRAFIDWPGYGTSNKDRGVERWLGLSDDEREAAKAGIPGYLSACRKDERKPYAMAGYLKNPEFWRHVAPPSALAMAKPYGKGWGAAVLRRLFGPHAERMSPPTRFMQTLIAQGGDEGRKARLQHLAAHGWPEVNRMLDDAAQRRGFAVSDDELALGEGFKPIEVGTPLWAEWDGEFTRRGWPWLDGSHLSHNCPAKYVYLPECAIALDEPGPVMRRAVCEALAAFEHALAGQTTNSEAAE